MNVLITTYFRSDQLELLLESIKPQILESEKIYIVYQVSDSETSDLLRRLKSSSIIQIPISESGAVRAICAGLGKMTPNGFLLLDDDVILPSDYLERLRNLIEDFPTSIIAGTNVVINRRIESTDSIDKLTRLGISSKRHSIGKKRKYGFIVGRFQEPFYGDIRAVDHFQGCNVYFPNVNIFPSLKFLGDSVYYEMSWAFKLKKDFEIYVKPDLAVLHVQPQDQIRISVRDNHAPKRIYTSSRNMSLVMSEVSSPIERFLTTSWFLFIGQKPIYGLLRAALSVPTEGIAPKIACKRFKLTYRGWINGRKKRYE